MYHVTSAHTRTPVRGRIAVYCEVDGEVKPVKYRILDRIMGALRTSEVGKWFKMNNNEYPHARYTIITLIDYMNRTVYKASLNPRNQTAFLTERPEAYDKTVIRSLYRTYDSWHNKLLSNCRGGELFSESVIYRSEYNLTYLTRSLTILLSHIHNQTRRLAEQHWKRRYGQRSKNASASNSACASRPQSWLGRWASSPRPPRSKR